MDDVVEAGVAHGLQHAGPAPVGGDEGARQPPEEFGEAEHGTGERELEADEVDGDEGGLLGRFHEAGDGEAGGGHGAVGEEE